MDYAPQTPREARIADDARRTVLREVETWLRSKAEKCRAYPGEPADTNLHRAGAYENAAEHVRVQRERD